MSPLHRPPSRMRRRVAALAVASTLTLVGCSGGPAELTVGEHRPVADASSNTPSTSSSTPSTPSSTPSTGVPGTSDATPSEDTGDGVGDELFPDLGNPGIDVVHYDVELSYDPASGRLDAVVALELVATADRDELTLDAVGLDVSSVTVDGETAAFALDPPELRITPPGGLQRTDRYTVVVAYTAEPSGGPSEAGLPSGWFTTADGSYVLNEPDGARTWLPCNDHPSDKATYRFEVTVPEGKTAVANGALVSSAPGERLGDQPTTTWTWEMPDPMATYAVQLLTGDYEVVEASAAGVALSHAVLRTDRERMQPYFDVTGDQLSFFVQLFGPYPFDTYGVAITDSFGGLAMEQQARSLFSREDFPGKLDYTQHLLLAHELGHQWFGNAVTPATWSDIWLNESFATYLQWLWLDHVGLLELSEEAEENLRRRQGGDDATGAPEAAELFEYESYDGGAVVLHALRAELGDDAFFELLRRWVAQNAGASRTSADFIALASAIAERDLDEFFDDWLYAADLPDEFPGLQAA